MDVATISGLTTSRLKSMTLDSRADQSSRLAALVTLAGRGSPAALDGLRAAVAEVEDEVVAQRAIERLGKVGVADDVDVLRAVRTGNATTQRMLRTAKCFLSYRHRLGTYRLDEPKQRLAAASEEAGPITTGAATKKMTSRMELLPPPVLGLSAKPEGVGVRVSWRVAPSHDDGTLRTEDTAAATLALVSYLAGVLDL